MNARHRSDDVLHRKRQQAVLLQICCASLVIADRAVGQNPVLFRPGDDVVKGEQTQQGKYSARTTTPWYSLFQASKELSRAEQPKLKKKEGMIKKRDESEMSASLTEPLV
jgi:hypothetical protein